MQYQLNTEVWKSIFAIPSEIVDSHLKICGASSLRLILLIFRNGAKEIDLDYLMQQLGMSREDTQDALNYWVNAGILQIQDASTPKISEPAEPAPAAAADQTLHETRRELRPPPSSMIAKPNPLQIAEMAKNCPELSFLFHETEARLGKYLSPSDLSTLVYLYDWAGIPIDVILMVIEYCCSLGKKNFNYIQKTALSWVDLGIDTHEKAEAYLKRIIESNKWESSVKTALGIFHRDLIAKEKEMIRVWGEEYHFDIPLIRLAYERTVENTGKLSFPYMNSILKSWHQKGIRTPAEATVEQNKNEKSFSKRKPDKQSVPSYDIDEMEKMITYNHL